MKIGIYTPYLDSFGGGERYMLTIAEALSKDHTIDLFLDNHLFSLGGEKLVADLAKRFNLNLSNIQLVEAPLGVGGNFFKKNSFLKKYDLIFYLTDGSVFYSTAKKSIIHFQVPFKNTAAKNIWGRMKLSTWNLAICNSYFTDQVIKNEWPIKTEVVYPPVEVEAIKPLKKKKQILNVGRFTSFTKSKKQEAMVGSFIELYKTGKINGWSFHLAGSVEGDEGYVTQLKEMAKGFPVEFYPNIAFADLVKLYGQSCIYWHAAGLGEDDPAKMEHFGITTVEAMAGGCVPIVINKGGQTEIVENAKSGLLWNNLDQLQSLTVGLINDSKLMEEMSIQAISRSKLFSKEKFKEKIKSVIFSL